jgi:hypothetical protein
MPHLCVAPEDATVLRELLEAALTDIAREISHTDNRDFRRALVDRQKAFERLLDEVRQYEPDYLTARL